MFQLTKDSDTFDFDITGQVQSGGQPAGAWTVNPSNQIVLTRTDGATVLFDVGWRFNDRNQLGILAGNTEVFNFHSGPAVPLYSSQKDVLVVRPDDQNAFSFLLHATWRLDDQHNLVATINGLESVLDGFLQDPEGQFSYHFFDLVNVAGNENVLQFPGAWRHAVSGDGKVVLAFDYEKEDGSTGTFELPGNANIDPSFNEFVYDYDKGSNSYRLQFVGTLHVSSDFTITYRLDRQTTSTTFSLAAAFHQPNFNGNLALALKRTDGSGAPGDTLTIGGDFTAVLGAGNLSVGFHFTQPLSGNNQSFGFNGSFVAKNKNDVTWQFESNSTTMSINVSAHIQLGDVWTEERFKLTTQDGQVVGIQALFGIQF